MFALDGILFDTCVGGCAVRMFSGTFFHLSVLAATMDGTAHSVLHCLRRTTAGRAMHQPLPDHLEPCSTAALGVTATTSIGGFTSLYLQPVLTDWLPEHYRRSLAATGEIETS